MSDIFLSYANEDRPRAQLLAQALEDQGWLIFWDRTIPIGKTWREVIGKELSEARCVIVLWSKTSIESRWVHEEADDGERRGVLIPVLIENVLPPIGFRSIQAADLSDWDATEPTQAFGRLIADIAELIGQPPKEAKNERKRLDAEAEPASTTESGTVFRDRLRDGSEGPEMVVLPQGQFLMGSPDGDEEATEDEKPQHLVTIGYPFAVGCFPVTYDEYYRFAEATGRDEPENQESDRGRKPVINVNWDDAKAYVTWLSEQTGKQYRFLSEAEWEYACRAGTETRYSFGDDITTEDANFEPGIPNLRGGHLVQPKTAEVGGYPPNPWKLYDMHGNVWEWTEDCWNDSYSGAPDNGAAWTSGDCSHHVIRGGSWNNVPEALRSPSRIGILSDGRGSAIGFRIARTL